MKSIIKFTFFVLLIGVLTFISYKKEHSCENCGGNPSGSTNKSPIAHAGPDQVISLPADSVWLDDSLSNDPDGKISGYLWKKISGPAFFIIVNPTALKTSINAFVNGQPFNNHYN